MSIGFPGVVRAGRILIAPNLGNDAWKGFDLDCVSRRYGDPAGGGGGGAAGGGGIGGFGIHTQW